jgi:hypothetical protein
VNLPKPPGCNLAAFLLVDISRSDMMNENTEHIMPMKLTDRVAELEREVAELKRVARAGTQPLPDGRSNSDRSASDDWKSIVGIFKDDPFYDDMVRLGRAYRKRQPKC